MFSKILPGARFREMVFENEAFATVLENKKIQKKLSRTLTFCFIA